MGRSLTPRVIRSGPYWPTQPRTGDESGRIYRKKGLITRGRDGLFYEEAVAGLGDIPGGAEEFAQVALTGTLELTADSTTVTGTGTLFASECGLGQRIVVINPGIASWLIIPQRIVSDTEMVIWKAPDTTISGLTGWQIQRIFAIGNQRGTCLRGNAIKLDKGNYLSAGTGVFRIDGQTLAGSSLTMTLQPKLSLLDPTAETFTNFTLGMDTPTGVTAAGVAGGTKGMQAGEYSLVVQAARKETGGYNLASLRVDVTITAGQKVRVTLPAMDTTNGQNAWRISVTQFAQFAGGSVSKAYLNGPWFFFQPATQTQPNITCDDDDVSPAGGTFDIEWLDAEVMFNDKVDFVVPDDPPVEANYVAILNAIPIWCSCQGQGFTSHPAATAPGPFIVPAKPNNIEAAPLTLAFSSSPPETILGVVAAQGRLYLPTPNHLQIAQATPDDAVPTLIRPYWTDGFAHENQLIFLDGTLYGYVVSGPARSAGDGDLQEAQRDWAAPVFEITRHWNPAQVLVGYDPTEDVILMFHIADSLNAAGFWTTRVLGYSVSQQMWNYDDVISSDTQDMILGGVATVGDHLEMTVGGREA